MWVERQAVGRDPAPFEGDGGGMWLLEYRGPEGCDSSPGYQSEIGLRMRDPRSLPCVVFGEMALARAKKKNSFSLASHPVVSENTFCKINKCIPFVYTLKKSTDSFLPKS